MNKHLRHSHLDKLESPRLHSSLLPTIDRLTGRLFKALLTLVALGVITLGLGAYRYLFES